MQIQQSTIQPQFYVTMINEKGNGSTPSPGTGTVTGGSGLNSTEGVTQVVRAAGDYNSAYNNVDLNVTKASQDSATQQTQQQQPQGQALAAGSTLVGSNGAGSISVSSSGAGVQLNIVANNNQGGTVQRLAQGGLMQNTTLLGSGNLVNNLTSLNVVLGENTPTNGSLTGNLEQLKTLRPSGY
jgi:hypothetical protein